MIVGFTGCSYGPGGWSGVDLIMGDDRVKLRPLQSLKEIQDEKKNKICKSFLYQRELLFLSCLAIK